MVSRVVGYVTFRLGAFKQEEEEEVSRLGEPQQYKPAGHQSRQPLKPYIQTIPQALKPP